MPSHSDISRVSQRLWQQKSIATESTGTTGLLQSPLDILPETANEAAIQSAMQSNKISAQTADANRGTASSLASVADRTAPLSNDAIRSQVAGLSRAVSQTQPARLSQISSGQMQQLAAVNRLAHDRIAAVPDSLKSQIMTTGLPDNVTLYLPNETAGAASKAAGLAQDRAAPGIAEVFQSSQAANGDVSIVGRRLIGNEWYNFGTDTNISSSNPASTWIAPTRLLKSANPAQEKDLSAQRVIRDTQSLVDGPWKPYLKGAGLLPKPHTFDMRHSDKDGIKSVLATLNTITGTLQTIQSVAKGLQKGMELFGMMGSLGQLGGYMSIFNQMKLPGSPGELITALITGKGITPKKPAKAATAAANGVGKNGILVTKGGAAAAAIGDGLLAKAEAEKAEADKAKADKAKADKAKADKAKADKDPGKPNATITLAERLKLQQERADNFGKLFDGKLSPQEKNALEERNRQIESLLNYEGDEQESNLGTPQDEANHEPKNTPSITIAKPPSETEIADAYNEAILKRDAELDRAENLETAAQKKKNNADAWALIDSEKAEQLRNEAKQLELEAARIREGEKGVQDKQRQHEAGDAMRDFTGSVIDELELPGGKLPNAIKDVAGKVVISGIDDVTEAVIETEQDFNDWLRDTELGKKLRNSEWAKNVRESLKR